MSENGTSEHRLGGKPQNDPIFSKSKCKGEKVNLNNTEMLRYKEEKLS